MKVDFEREIQEFLDTIFDSPDKPLLFSLNDITYEGFDLIGKLIDALDEENRETEIRDLKESLKTAIKARVDNMPDANSFFAVSVSVLLPNVINVVVDALAEKSGPVAGVREKVTYALDEAAMTLARSRNALNPDAPKLLITFGESDVEVENEEEE